MGVTRARREAIKDPPSPPLDAAPAHAVRCPPVLCSRPRQGLLDPRGHVLPQCIMPGRRLPPPRPPNQPMNVAEQREHLLRGVPEALNAVELVALVLERREQCLSQGSVVLQASVMARMLMMIGVVAELAPMRRPRRAEQTRGVPEQVDHPSPGRGRLDSIAGLVAVLPATALGEDRSPRD
jgi:hypothetical protein